MESSLLFGVKGWCSSCGCGNDVYRYAHLPSCKIGVDVSSKPDETAIITPQTIEAQQPSLDEFNKSLNKALRNDPLGDGYIGMKWENLDGTYVPMTEVFTVDPVKSTYSTALWPSGFDYFREPHKYVEQTLELLSQQRMLMEDLTTTGHEVHIQACLGCGEDFKFVDSFICPPCAAKDQERLRRTGHENKLLHANGLEAFK